MITPFKRILIPLCILALLSIASLACRTAHGFGQDVEKAGESIQKGTR